MPGGLEAYFTSIVGQKLTRRSFDIRLDRWKFVYTHSLRERSLPIISASREVLYVGERPLWLEDLQRNKDTRTTNTSCSLRRVDCSQTNVSFSPLCKVKKDVKNGPAAGATKCRLPGGRKAASTHGMQAILFQVKTVHDGGSSFCSLHTRAKKNDKI